MALRFTPTPEEIEDERRFFERLASCPPKFRGRFAMEMRPEDIQDEINKHLFFPEPEQTVKQVMSFQVPRDKVGMWGFFRGFTRFQTIGSGVVVKEGKIVEQYPEEKNFQVDIEYRDTPDNCVQNRLTHLFKAYNRKVVGEDLLALRHSRLEESTLTQH